MNRLEPATQASARKVSFLESIPPLEAENEEEDFELVDEFRDNLNEIKEMIRSLQAARKEEDEATAKERKRQEEEAKAKEREGEEEAAKAKKRKEEEE
eukprot:345852-Hanusia_phi.AAC.1